MRMQRQFNSIRVGDDYDEDSQPNVSFGGDLRGSMGGGGELEHGENFRPMAVDHYRHEAHNRSNRSFAEEVERENSV